MRKGFAPITILVGLFLTLSLVAGAYFLGTQKNKQAISTVIPAITPAPSTSENVVKTSPSNVVDVTSGLENINTLKLSGVCGQGQLPDVQLTLQKAYIVSKILDYPDFKQINTNFPLIGDKRFLIIESNARNINTQINQYHTVYTSYYFRLRRDGSDSSPIIYPKPNLGPQENGQAFAVFPIKQDENSFQVLFCNLASPRVLNLDFTSNVENIKGNFSMDKGLINTR